MVYKTPDGSHFNHLADGFCLVAPWILIEISPACGYFNHLADGFCLVAFLRSGSIQQDINFNHLADGFCLVAFLRSGSIQQDINFNHLADGFCLVAQLAELLEAGVLRISIILLMVSVLWRISVRSSNYDLIRFQSSC